MCGFQCLYSTWNLLAFNSDASLFSANRISTVIFGLILLHSFPGTRITYTFYGLGFSHRGQMFCSISISSKSSVCDQPLSLLVLSGVQAAVWFICYMYEWVDLETMGRVKALLPRLINPLCNHYDAFL